MTISVEYPKVLRKEQKAPEIGRNSSFGLGFCFESAP